MEVLNDLYDYGLKIYQDSELFKFSLDSLLLAEFVTVKKTDKTLLDMCSGNAPLPLIIGKRHNIDITGIEITEEICNLAKKSIKENKLANIKMLNCNAKELKNYFPGNNFDIITCNPPFFKVDKTSLINTEIKKALARHEIAITLSEIFELTKYLLKENGTFYLVHRPERLEEIITLANQNKLHVKEMIFIYSNIKRNAIMVLFKMKKHAQIGVKIKSFIIWIFLISILIRLIKIHQLSWWFFILRVKPYFKGSTKSCVA